MPMELAKGGIIMGCCRYKEFLKELDYCKSEMNVWGTNFDIMQSVWTLKRQVKDWFPMNEVPEEIMTSISLLELRMFQAKESMDEACNSIINQVEMERKKVYPDG